MQWFSYIVADIFFFFRKVDQTLMPDKIKTFKRWNRKIKIQKVRSKCAGFVENFKDKIDQVEKKNLPFFLLPRK